METFLWSCQILLALAFMYSGYCKTFFSKKKVLSMGQTGAGEVSLLMMRFIGISEL